MRMLVVSDTHGDFHALYDLLQRQPPTDLLLHLGDGQQELDDLAAVFPALGIYRVRGNCDFVPSALDEVCFCTEGVRILMVHGHRFGVDHSYERLLQAAADKQASIALFGHTHRQHYSVENGIHLMNPGSLSRPRDSGPGYGVIEISGGQAICQTFRFI